ncbi:MAG: acyltransferase family protein [Bdellovibrionota bacterium]
MNSHSLKYRADIDGLRAIAILGVVIFHLFPKILPGGYLGVDVFFVISGFLISSIIKKSVEEKNFSFKQFYKRRILRIFPALFFTITASLCFGYFYLLENEFYSLAQHVVGGAFFVTNWIFQHESTQYFSISGEFKPLLHLWSISVEEQFYIFYPLILYLSLKLGLKIRITIATLFVLSLCFFILRSLNTSGQMLFFSTPYRLWELLAGGLLTVQFNGKLFKKYLPYLGMTLVLLSYFLVSEEAGPTGKISAVAGAMLVLLPRKESDSMDNFLSHKILVKIGLISYSLYLCHWPVYSFARILNGAPLSNLNSILILISCIFLAYFFWLLVENPIRKSGTPLLWLFLMTTIGISSYLISQNYIPESKYYKTHMDDWGQRDCKAGVDVAEIGDFTCLMPSDGMKVANVLLLGDSHARDKFIGLNILDKRHAWQLIFKPACPPTFDSKNKINSDCQIRMNSILRWTAEQNRIKTVVLGFHHPHNNPMEEKLLYRGLRESVNYLLQHNKQVILLIDIPIFPGEIKDCLRTDRKCSFDSKQVLRVQKPHRTMVNEIMREYPVVRVFDPYPIFCNDKECEITADGEAIYFDSSHLNFKGSHLYAERFLKMIPL